MTTPSRRELRLDPRFNGPAGTANGGFACGSLAALLGGTAVEVTLRRPVPLGRPLQARHDRDGTMLLEDGGALLAEARPAAPETELVVPDAATPEEARAAVGAGSYYDDPWFPGCFVCGPARPQGDGLRIFPGPVAGRTLWAAPWTPDPSLAAADGRVRPEMVWAVLDCPGGIAIADANLLPAGTAAVLGRMTASLAAAPRPGDDCLLVAWPTGRDGRKFGAGSALLSRGGDVLAAAQAIWISVPRPAPDTKGRRRAR
jgi:hypothetical protein